MNKIKTTPLRTAGSMKKVLADMFVQYGAMGIPPGLAIMLSSLIFFCESTDRGSPRGLDSITVECYRRLRRQVISAYQISSCA
jgi:hypothetical protein